MENNNTFTGYELDRDIPSIIWNHYMKKYIEDYVLFKDEDGIWAIKCKYGNIAPYSLKKGLLVFASVMFPTKGKKTYFIKKLPYFTEITQEGEWEVNFKFPEEKLEELQEIVKVKKRMKLSQEERERRAKQLILNKKEAK